MHIYLISGKLERHFQVLTERLIQVIRLVALTLDLNILIIIINDHRSSRNDLNTFRKRRRHRQVPTRQFRRPMTCLRSA